MMTNAHPQTGFLKTTERFRIGYWNNRAVNQETHPGKLNSVMRTLDKFRIDIAGLSETRLTGFGTLNSETYHILYSGLETRKEAGVGMALSSWANKCLVDWEPINERILRTRFATSQAKLTVIVVYAPTNDTVDQTKDDFYRVLSNVVAKVHRHDIVTLYGDFNAKVVSDASYAPAILGRHGLGEINDNGVRLIDFCATHELIVGASWFPYKQIHKYTWNSPDGVTRNEIDHILIAKHRRRCLEDLRPFEVPTSIPTINLLLLSLS